MSRADIQERKRLLDEIDRLRAIVESAPNLPADGTPIRIGMTVYDATRLGHDGERISGVTTHPDGRLACLYFTDGVSVGFDTAVDCYYGTAEAAAKARAR